MTLWQKENKTFGRFPSTQPSAWYLRQVIPGSACITKGSSQRTCVHHTSRSCTIPLEALCSPAVLCGIYLALGGETGAGRSWFTPKRCPQCPLSCLALMQARSLHCSPPQSLLSKEHKRYKELCWPEGC